MVNFLVELNCIMEIFNKTVLLKFYNANKQSIYILK